MPRQNPIELNNRQGVNLGLGTVQAQVTARPVSTVVAPEATNLGRLADALKTVDPAINNIFNQWQQKQAVEAEQARKQEAAQQVLNGDMTRKYGNQDYLDTMDRLYANKAQGVIAERIHTEATQAFDQKDWSWDPKAALQRIAGEELKGIENPLFTADVLAKVDQSWMPYESQRKAMADKWRVDTYRETHNAINDTNLKLYAEGKYDGVDAQGSKSDGWTNLMADVNAQAKAARAAGLNTNEINSSFVSAALSMTGKMANTPEGVKRAHEMLNNLEFNAKGDNGYLLSSDPESRAKIQQQRSMLIQQEEHVRKKLNDATYEALGQEGLVIEKRIRENPDDPATLQAAAAYSEKVLGMAGSGVIKAGQHDKLTSEPNNYIKTQNAVLKEQGKVSGNVGFYMQHGSESEKKTAKELMNRALVPQMNVLDDPASTPEQKTQAQKNIGYLLEEHSKNGILSDSPVAKTMFELIQSPVPAGQPVPFKVEAAGKAMAQIFNNPDNLGQMHSLLSKFGDRGTYWAEAYVRGYTSGGHADGIKEASKVLSPDWKKPEAPKPEVFGSGWVSERFKTAEGKQVDLPQDAVMTIQQESKRLQVEKGMTPYAANHEAVNSYKKKTAVTKDGVLIPRIEGLPSSADKLQRATQDAGMQSLVSAGIMKYEDARDYNITVGVPDREGNVSVSYARKGSDYDGAVPMTILVTEKDLQKSYLESIGKNPESWLNGYNNLVDVVKAYGVSAQSTRDLSEVPEAAALKWQEVQKLKANTSMGMWDKLKELNAINSKYYNMGFRSSTNVIKTLQDDAFAVYLFGASMSSTKEYKIFGDNQPNVGSLTGSGDDKVKLADAISGAVVDAGRAVAPPSSETSYVMRGANGATQAQLQEVTMMFAKPELVPYRSIAAVEGFSPKSYSDSGTYSIGFGTSGNQSDEVLRNGAKAAGITNPDEWIKKLRAGEKLEISPNQAMAFFKARIEDDHKQLGKYMGGADAVEQFKYKNPTAYSFLMNLQYNWPAGAREVAAVWVKGGDGNLKEGITRLYSMAEKADKARMEKGKDPQNLRVQSMRMRDFANGIPTSDYLSRHLLDWSFDFKHGHREMTIKK